MSLQNLDDPNLFDVDPDLLNPDIAQ
jgi:hypothetical protein